MTRMAATRPAHGGRWRRSSRCSYVGRPHPGRDGAEGETFELCLALLEEAIARAERWCVLRERALGDFDRRAADMVRRLRNAGMIKVTTRWEGA
ncbi:MAG TPA: hypothetical protein VF080_02100 [Solirubrobacteraceae bacterium]